MTNYTLTRYVSDVKGTFAEALAALETQLETVADSKTIYVARVVEVRGGYEAYALYAT
jgi:hypothetical protein